MTLTINQRFRALVAAKHLVMWVSTFTIAYYAFTHLHGFVRQLTILSFALLGVGMLVVYLVTRALLQCPRCHFDLHGQTMVVMQGTKIPACPHCGLGVNDPWPG